MVERADSQQQAPPHSSPTPSGGIDNGRLSPALGGDTQTTQEDSLPPRALPQPNPNLLQSEGDSSSFTGPPSSGTGTSKEPGEMRETGIGQFCDSGKLAQDQSIRYTAPNDTPNFQPFGSDTPLNFPCAPPGNRQLRRTRPFSPGACRRLSTETSGPFTSFTRSRRTIHNNLFATPWNAQLPRWVG
jgi:hypothetical protein